MGQLFHCLHVVKRVFFFFLYSLNLSSIYHLSSFITHCSVLFQIQHILMLPDVKFKAYCEPSWHQDIQYIAI